MMLTKGKQTLIAEDSVSNAEDMRAEICKCQGVTLHLGPMSLRFSRESFSRFFVFVSAVHRRLCEVHGELKREEHNAASSQPRGAGGLIN